MAKQPEQILDEQLIAQIFNLGWSTAIFFRFRSIKINSIKNLTVKMFTEFKKDINFVSTVLATLKSERVAYQDESYSTVILLIIIHLLCLSTMHT